MSRKNPDRKISTRAKQTSEGSGADVADQDRRRARTVAGGLSPSATLLHSPNAPEPSFSNAVALGPRRKSLELVRTNAVPIGLFVLFAWMVRQGFDTFRRIVQFYNPLPFQDYWDEIGNFGRYKALDFSAFWEQHVDHRILFPKIIFAIDTFVCHGTEILPLIVSGLCYVCTWLLLSTALFSDGRVSPAIRLAGAFTTGALMFSQGSASVLAYPFLLQWTLVQAAMVGCFACLSRAECDRYGWLGAAVAAGVVATYSSGNGMFVWPLLVAAGILRKLSRRQITVIAISAVISIGLYFVGFRFSRDTHFSYLLTHPLYSIGWVSSYLGMPFAAWQSPAFGVCAGLTNVVIALLLLYVAIRRNLLVSRTGIVLFGSYLFTLSTALVTAAGRMQLSDYTFATAKASRYITVALVGWTVLILMCLWILSRLRWRWASPDLAVCAAGLALFIAFRNQNLNGWLDVESEQAGTAQTAAVSVQNGLMDPAHLILLYPYLDKLPRYISTLKENRLSIFHEEPRRDAWLGKRITDLGQVRSASFSGEIGYVYPLQSGLQVAGWADTAPYAWIALVNENGEIVGFGRRIEAGLPKGMLASRVPKALAWIGFINSRQRAKAITAYEVDRRDDTLSAFGDTTSVPPVHSASREEIGPPIEGVIWRNEASWSDILPRWEGFGKPAGNIRSSLSSTGPQTGEISSEPLSVPANACLLLPVLHGYDANNLSIAIRNADTGAVITHVPMTTGEVQWVYWRVDFDHAVKRVQIIAKDQGQDPGQWLAVADPEQCR